MALTTLVIGENALVTRNLKQADGTTDLLLDDIQSIVVELEQDGDTKKTWEFDSPSTFTQGFRQSDDAQVEIELEVEDSLTLDVGTASLRWTIEVTNPAFFVEGQQTSIITEDVFDVVEESST